MNLHVNMRMKDRRTLMRLTRASVGQFTALDRVSRMKQIALQWAFMHEADSIPEKFPHELWPGIEGMTATVSLSMTHPYELPLGERAILDGVVRYKRPTTIFEFGTFTGATTAVLADAAPDCATVHTIDLPEDAFPPGGFHGWFTSDWVGRAFARDARYQNRIVLHRQDLRMFDFREFLGRVDLIFIDADHSYEGVIRDSRCALKLLAPGGLVIWDDYQWSEWESVRALNRVASEVPLVRIAHSRLVVHQRNPCFTSTACVPASDANDAPTV